MNLRWRIEAFIERRDPRPFKPCPTCLDFGMLEDYRGDQEPCPDCEGGIWRERVPWALWIERQRLFGYRVTLPRRRFPNRRFRIWKDWPA